MAEAVKVVVRCRPINATEIADGRKQIVEVVPSRGEVVLTDPNSPGPDNVKRFTFDKTFAYDCTQREVFDGVASAQVDAALQGFNATIFAYGQTGTGKTYTMEGKGDPETQGVIPNSFDKIFFAAEGDTTGREYLVKCSMLEIYNEEIRDLLGNDPKAKLGLREEKGAGVYVAGLSQFVAKSPENMYRFLDIGRKNRAVGATAMNAGSSRSHCVFMVTVASSIPVAGNPEGDQPRVGKLNLVDLAGSERAGKTGAQGDRFQEGIKINMSLTALGNVISALVDGKKHIPYRDSKLTRLLQDALGGNTKTVMFAMLGPADWNYDETLSTLRYANRAKNIKNKPVVNEDPRDAAIRGYVEEIAKLREAISQLDGSGAGEKVSRGILPLIIPMRAPGAKQGGPKLLPIPLAGQLQPGEEKVVHKYVPMPIQGHPPEQAPQPVVRPFRVPFTLPDRTKQPDAADAAAPDAAAVPGGSAAGEGGKEGGSGDKGGGEPSERPAGEEAAAKTRVIPVPFKVEKQGAAAEATGGEEAAGGKARIVPMPYQKAAVSRPAARVEPVPELTDFYAGWTPLQRWWFRVALCCFRPATSARVVPGTDATAFAEAMEKDAWRRAAEVADKESAAAVTLLEKYAAMPPPPASDREVVATLVAAVKRIGKWLIIACLIVFAGLSAMGAVVNNGIYVPVWSAHSANHRPPVILSDFKEAWCELDTFSIPYDFQQDSSLPKECCNNKGQDWSIKLACCDMYVNVWPTLDEVNYKNSLGYTSIERYNCRREKLEFSEIIDQYSPLSQPESGFDDSETKLDPNKVDETLDKPTEPRRRSAARRLSGTADIAAQHTAMISGHMVKAGRVPSIPRSGSQEQEAAGQQAHAAQSTASAHAKRAVSTAASRKLNFLTEEQMAQCTDEAPCNCTDCIFFDTTVDGSLIGICGLCSTVATYDVRREITYGGPEIVEECSWEEDWCQCGSCSYRSEAEGIEEVLVCDACTHVADFYPDSLDQPALIDACTDDNCWCEWCEDLEPDFPDRAMCAHCYQRPEPMQLPDQAAKACEPDKPCLCQKCSVNADDFLTCPREACLPMPVVLPSSAPDGFESTELATGFQSALPSRDRAEIVIDSTTYELPFTYNNYDYDSSGDYVDPAAKGSPCLPSYLTSMQWYLPKYKTDALGRPTRELEFQLWTKEDFDAAGLKTPLTGMRFKCMVASEWLGEEPGICGLSSVHAKCGNIDNDISPTEYGDSQRAKFMIEECRHYDQWPDCGIVPANTPQWAKVLPDSAMGSYRDHEREIKAFLWSATALYVLCALLLTLAFVLHRYWIEKESGFEDSPVGGRRARGADMSAAISKAAHVHPEIHDIRDGYVSYTDGDGSKVRFVNLASRPVDVRVIDHDAPDNPETPEREAEFSLGTLEVGQTVKFDLPQGAWIRARPLDGTMEALYFSENFVYTSTYARVPGKDIVPQPCSPRTAWMVPTVTYHDYRVVVGVHELDYGQSLIPSYVDSKGRVHRKQSRTRIKTLMAKAKAAALLGIRDPRAVAQMDPDKDIGAKPDQAPEGAGPGDWVVEGGKWTWKNADAGGDGDPDVFDQEELERPEVLEVRGVASVDADPSRPVAVTLVNAESVTIAISAIKADGSKEKLQTLKPRRRFKGELPAGTWLALDNVSDASEMLFFEEHLVPITKAARRQSKTHHPPGASARTCWMVPFKGHKGYGTRVLIRLVSGVDGRIIPVNFPKKGSLGGPEVVDVRGANATGRIEDVEEVTLSNVTKEAIDVFSLDADGVAQLEFTLKASQTMRYAFRMGSWLRAAKQSDPTSPLFFDEGLDYVGPGMPSVFPRGASPRTAWMVPYDVNREYESRVFIGEVSAVGGVLLPLDLTAARDVKILQSISQA